MFVKIDSHETSSNLIRQILKKQNLSYVSCLKKFIDAIDTMQDAIFKLLVRDYLVSIKTMNFSRDYKHHNYVHDLSRYA